MLSHNFFSSWTVLNSWEGQCQVAVTGQETPSKWQSLVPSRKGLIYILESLNLELSMSLP